jgi:hypothetical protein
MGNWENTTYVQHDDAQGVADALVELFSAEGMRRVPRPAPRKPARFDPMQYAGALVNNLWGVALFTGSPGWTVIKTAPLEMLGERAPGAARMRLADLVKRLGSAACQVNLYDSSSLLLVEVDREGRCELSGYCVRSGNPDPLRFNGEEIAEDRVDIRFERLPMQPVVDACTHSRDGRAWLDNDEFVSRLAEALGGKSAAACSNLTSIDFLLRHLPLAMASGIELYFEWPARDRHSQQLEMLMAGGRTSSVGGWSFPQGVMD